MNIFVAGFPKSFGKKELEDLFKQHGTVNSAKIILNRDTGESRCFGFVEMPEDSEAKKAVTGLHEFMIEERKLTVKEARNQ